MGLEKAERIPKESVEIVKDDEEVLEMKTDETSVTLAVPDENISVPEVKDKDILNPDIGMDIKVSVASKVADSLKDVLESQDLVVYGLNKKAPEKGYVTVEGWNTLGTMLGISEVTEKVEQFKPATARYGYRARVSLYQNAVMRNGEIVEGTLLSSAEAVAVSGKFQKDESSIYSMAQTRATGKAYRMALSWIMKLAGYEPTPAEEMPTNKGK